MANKMSFATETVFSHWRQRADGTFESKADLILELQQAGYYVTLIFVGLATPAISALRVLQRWEEGGHNVPLEKIEQRFPRTQKAIGNAAPISDMTLMFDNSFDEKRAFSLVRVQKGPLVLFDCRDTQYVVSHGLRNVASRWLTNVVGPWKAREN
jgi:predicted ABC-type ATPase